MEINDDKLERGRHIDYQECIQPFRVSDTQIILWDHRSCGLPNDITICPYKNLVVLIRDKALGTGWNLLENKKQMAMTLNLIGSINFNSKALDGRFEILLQYLKENEDDQLLACDITTPIKFAKKYECCTDVTEEEFLSDLNAISYACRSEFSVELSRFIKMRIICQIQGPNCVIMIKMMTAGMEFFAVPIPQIPILNTALSNRLLNSESEICTGFVSMNKSRKLVMLLENDPKVFNFPLVGIWVSGISTVFHSFVWASCLRYINCSKYSERLCLPPQPFLLVLYSTLYCNPEFYDCTTKSGTCELSYDLYEGSAKTTLARVPMIDTKVTKVELFKVADKKKCKLFINAEEQMKLEKNMSYINNINDMPQICPHPQQLRIINPQPVVPDLSLSDSRNQQNKDICFSCTTNFTNNDNKEMTISEYLRNENKTSQNSVKNTLIEKMEKCNCFNIEKENPICSQETSSRKSLIPIKQFPSIINKYDDKIKSVTDKNNISNTRQTERQQRRNELLNDETKTKEQFNQNAIPDDIYKLLQHQEKQLQLLQQQIKLLREQNENLTREVKVHSKCTQQAPLISVGTMTSMDSRSENQSSHKKKLLVNEEIQTNPCNKSNIRVGKETNHSYMDKCCFPNNCNSKGSGESTEFAPEEFRFDTFSENHDNSFSSIIDVPDYCTSTHSNCSNEEELILGESASTKGNQSDNNEIFVEVPDKENGDNMKREFYTSENEDVERKNQLYLIPEVNKNENVSKEKLYDDFLDTIDRFLVRTPNVELPISEKVLNSLQNWTAEVSLLGPEICWDHLPKLSYSYTEISLSMATKKLTLKYLGDDHLTKTKTFSLPENLNRSSDFTPYGVSPSNVSFATKRYLERHYDQLTKTFSPPESLTRSSDLTPYGLSPSNVSFATERYLERHGLVTIGNFALDREIEDKCKY